MCVTLELIFERAALGGRCSIFKTRRKLLSSSSYVGKQATVGLARPRHFFSCPLPPGRFRSNRRRTGRHGGEAGGGCGSWSCATRRRECLALFTWICTGVYTCVCVCVFFLRVFRLFWGCGCVSLSVCVMRECFDGWWVTSAPPHRSIDHSSTDGFCFLCVSPRWFSQERREVRARGALHGAVWVCGQPRGGRP